MARPVQNTLPRDTTSATLGSINMFDADYVNKKTAARSELADTRVVELGGSTSTAEMAGRLGHSNSTLQAIIESYT